MSILKVTNPKAEALEEARERRKAPVPLALATSRMDGERSRHRSYGAIGSSFVKRQLSDALPVAGMMASRNRVNLPGSKQVNVSH
ncbi:hypothetical protein GCM10009425_46440 [Pseudomonas asuensis]|uniref:Transcriptional regulator n=1 Tax=Pseudomonas asuensis TaxID=1825787 RepID=A0ABQ2H4N9_9PSED|nr:hypothetical protein GCM10009425_46440 [Pseudomonas asuensis]